jgi:hypothetical protein
LAFGPVAILFVCSPPLARSTSGLPPVPPPVRIRVLRRAKLLIFPPLQMELPALAAPANAIRTADHPAQVEVDSFE